MPLARIVRMLLPKASAAVLNMRLSAQLNDGYLGETALILAVDVGRLEIVQALLERPNLEVNKRCKHGRHMGCNAAESAVFRRHVDILELLCWRDDFDFNDAGAQPYWCRGR